MADKYGRGSDLPVKGASGGGPYMRGSDYSTPNELNQNPDNPPGSYEHMRGKEQDVSNHTMRELGTRMGRDGYEAVKGQLD